jgi:hypothetical protein
MKSYPRVEQVILAYETIGIGTDENPFRTIVKIYTLDGQLIGSGIDPMVEAIKKPIIDE